MPQTLEYQCMEVWGGSQSADNGVVMPGVDVWVQSRPFQGDDAGGDVHYVSSCATGRITRFLLADVSGHGRAVADVATTLRTLMRRFVNFIDQGRLVRELNHSFAHAARGGTFATAIVATYFTPTGELTLCNAGHPRPLLYDSRRRRWRLVDAYDRVPQIDANASSNLPLGIFEGVDYATTSFTLAPGDCLVLYTDALIESLGADAKPVGEQGLLRLAGELTPTDLSGLLTQLWRRLQDLGGPARDDATLLAIRPNDLRPRTSLAQQLGAAARFVRMLATRPSDLPWPEWSRQNLLGALWPGFHRRRAHDPRP